MKTKQLYEDAVLNYYRTFRESQQSFDYTKGDQFFVRIIAAEDWIIMYLFRFLHFYICAPPLQFL